jgi:hypothetical protein
MTKRLVLALAVAAAAAGTAGGARADVSQTPVATGCPTAYSLFPVPTPPYRVASLLDDPANGGNHDGYVCAHALPDAVRDAFCARGLLGYCLLQQFGLSAYQFTEDDSPANQNAQAGG